MTDSYNEFHARVARIYALKDEASKDGSSPASYGTTRDGHLVIRGARPGFRIPWTGILMVLVAVFMLKGAVMARLGPDFYKAQVGRLMPSTVLEQVGAWTMRPDPISSWVARQIKSLS
ncbi:MAG: hypothetical protein OQK00_03785 [Rhodobacteraceae bacterium]|nr:hypothetical protein [Paracoccaceae bacterium]MCW9042373.1 hypothetical protein [Pseudopelagicola sp.]